MAENIVLRNMKMLDGTSADIVIENRKIVDIALPGTAAGERIIDYQEKVYVSNGWIDMHMHAFPEFVPYGDDIDEIGYKTGVTTIVDAGSTGADRIHELTGNAKKAKTNVSVFLNKEALKRAVLGNNHFIVGLKARISSSVVEGNGIEPLKITREFLRCLGVRGMLSVKSGVMIE